MDRREDLRPHRSLRNERPDASDRRSGSDEITGHLSLETGKTGLFAGGRLTERGDRNVPSGRCAEGTREHCADEPLVAYDRTLGDHHHRATPALEMNHPEASKGKLPGKVRNDELQRGSSNGAASAESSRDALTRTSTDLSSDEQKRLRRRTLEGFESRRWNEHERSSARVGRRPRRLPALQVEPNRTVGIEGRTGYGHPRTFIEVSQIGCQIGIGRHEMVRVGALASTARRIALRERLDVPAWARAWAVALLLLATTLGVCPAAAEGEESNLDGPKSGAIDPDVAPGPLVVYSARPELATDLRACSIHVPICVHTALPEDRLGATHILAAFEHAWQIMTGSLALNPPDVDPTTLAYDVFMVDGASLGSEVSTTKLEARDVRSRIDRGRSFTLVDRRVRSGCVLDALASKEIARASLYREAPGTEEGTARAQSTSLAELVVPCAVGLSADAVQTFQSRPERTFCDDAAGEEATVAGGSLPKTSPRRASALYSNGASAFWTRLDWAFGRSPGVIVPASWALHPTTTPVGANRWVNEPDTFDVLQKTFKGAFSTGGTVHDLWLDFAIARAFLGSADDGFHLPELRTLGDSARVPLDWDIAWPTTPRRLAARAPIYPTGSGYLLIHREGARPGSRLRVETEWEELALFRWAFVKIDARGREIGRVVIPTKERATQAQMTLVDLDGVDRILLVGVNLGDPAYAFDPDDEVWEPHGFAVTVAEERPR